MPNPAPSTVADAIANIEAAVEQVGLPELAQRSGVPYTTLAEWRSKQWRPRTIETFERVAVAAASLTVQEP